MMLGSAARVVTLVVEPLTPEAFGPFGTVLGRRAGGPQFELEIEHVAVEAWIHDVLDMSGGQVEVQSFTITVRDMVAAYLERHVLETQTFAQMDGVPAIFPVAAPTDGDGPDHCPEPDSVRAFLMNGSQGIKLHKGTWHWVPFPIGATGVYLNLTRAGKFNDVIEGSQAGQSRGDFQRRDMRALRGVEFRFAL